jgi:hypothetical protein
VEVEWSDDELFGSVPISVAALAPIASIPGSTK